MKKVIVKQDLIDKVSHIENWGRDYQNYRLYFHNLQPNGDREYMDITEKEFYELDTIFDGELATKLIN